MQSIIYITDNAMATVTALDGLDEGARDLLAWRPETDLRAAPGYYLAAEAMKLAVLPEGASVALVLSPVDTAKYARHVSYPPELRGVVFSGAPRLPKDYARTLAYWSPLLVTADHDGAEHVQCLLNEYEVSEGDFLLSNGVVLILVNVLELLEGLQPESFVEVRVPVDASMLGLDRARWDSGEAYGQDIHLPYERLYLKVQTLLASPTPDFAAIACIHSEQWDSSFNQ